MFYEGNCEFMENKITYKDAGVDIEAGNRAVNMIKGSVKSTYRPEVIGELGGFGGLFALNAQKYENPVLVSGADGVGTKLKLAFMADKHDTIGQDAVAMCVNDILVHGAEPLFFLDYLALDKIDEEKTQKIVGGVADACKEAGCALIGGETAEMGGFYREGEYDVAGFAVGIVERDKLITGEKIKEGDVVLGVPSSGLHSNGFSLVRKIVFDVKHLRLEDHIDELGKTLGEELLTPTRLYPKVCLPLIHEFQISGMAHITGGGLYDNIERILPQGLAATIHADAWEAPLIFSLLKVWGNLATAEMYRTFNMGIGMVIIADPMEAAKIRVRLSTMREECFDIGRIVKGDGKVTIKGATDDDNKA